MEKAFAEGSAAVDQAKAVVAATPHNARARRQLASALRRSGRHEEASHVEAEAIRLSANSASLLEAARAMRDRDVARAETLLRSHLQTDPEDPQALRMLAEIAAVCGHGDEAERLLRKALAHAPGFVPLYINLATLLQDLKRDKEALAILDETLARDPANTLVLSVKAGILAGAGRTLEALEAQEKLLAQAPDMANAWTNYAQMLLGLGRPKDALAAFRSALRLDSTSGVAWWGLANAKLARLEQADIAAMEQALTRAPDDLNRMQLQFALGKALGDQGRFEESFRRYAAANAMRQALIPYDPRQIEEIVQKAQAVFTPDRLQARADRRQAATVPIFIVGMPRSGSTLVEQILASHPLIEGLGELFSLDRTAARLFPPGGGPTSWLDAVPGLGGAALQALGEDYLRSAEAGRKTDRPFFSDKMPFNWIHAGLIQMILPNARIVDVRRHPVACCLSNYTLYFNRQTNFASSQEDLGRYYRAYVRMMAHLDEVRPGQIHRLLHEDLVADPEAEIRKLLEYLGLPFDEACLRFYENPREVRTPSAQQVRKPINAEGLEYWRNYEAWLAPLKRALGPLLDGYEPSDRQEI